MEDKTLDNKCWVVTVLECNTNNPDKEAPEGCCECGMLDYLCFNTVEEANEAYTNLHKTIN